MKNDLQKETQLKNKKKFKNFKGFYYNTILYKNAFKIIKKIKKKIKKKNSSARFASKQGLI
jgi:hypothetical protein